MMDNLRFALSIRDDYFERGEWPLTEAGLLSAASPTSGDSSPGFSVAAPLVSSLVVSFVELLAILFIFFMILNDYVPFQNALIYLRSQIDCWALIWCTFGVESQR